MDRYGPRKGKNQFTSGKNFRETYRQLKPVTPPKPLEPRDNLVSYGPKVFALSQGPINEGEGPGEPPAGFVGATTSKTEWFVYWALDKICKPMGVEFTFQESFQGGRHVPGGSVVDFVVYMPLYQILIRVQTYRFHFAFGSEKQATDFEQKITLGDREDTVVIDIYEQDFIFDDTGRAVLHVVSDALRLDERSNPLATGNVYDNGG